MSSVRMYRTMLAQRERIEAFRRAIGQVVQSGDRVLEVGTGLGTFAAFAVEAGASRVWAVDADPIVHVAKAIAELNGYADRVEFVRGRVPAVDISDPCDVVLYEDFPPRVLGPAGFRMLRAVREHFLAPGARVVPRTARIFLAPVASSRLRREILSFDDPGDRRYGIDWSPSRSYVTNGPMAITVTPEDLAAPPVAAATFRLDEPDAHHLGGSGTWQLERGHAVDGMAFWFDLELAPEEWLSNAPGSPSASWGQLVVPFEDPLPVSAGDRLTARVGPNVLPDGAPGWFAWEAEANGTTVRGSEFAAEPAGRADVVGPDLDDQPLLDREGAFEAEVLALTDGTRTFADIVEEVVQRHPHLGELAPDRVRAVLQGRCVSPIPNEA